MHELDGDRSSMTQAPSYMRDAARADRAAEDRVTAGERVGERPQGFAPRLRRARRAVLQEACSLAPVCFSRLVASTSTSSTRSRQPPRHRGDDDYTGTHHASGKTSGRVADHCASLTAVGPQPSMAKRTWRHHHFRKNGIRSANGAQSATGKTRSDQPPNVLATRQFFCGNVFWRGKATAPSQFAGGRAIVMVARAQAGSIGARAM